MPIVITRSPRDDLLMRANECVNPRMGSYAYWMSSGAGNGSANDTYSSAAGTLEKYWQTAPTNVDNAGWYYRQQSWVGSAQKTASGSIYYQGWQPKMTVKFFHYNRDGGLITTNKGADFQLVYNTGSNTGETRISGTATSPADTFFTDIQFCAVAGNNPPQGQGMALRKVLIEPGATVGTYFDGSTYINGNGTQHTAWEGGADGSRSLLYDQDPNNVMTPNFSEGWDEVSPTRNRFFETLDGNQALIQQSSSWRTGVLRLMFGDPSLTAAQARALAETCRTQHKKKGTFTYSDDALGTLATFTYAVNGDVRLYPTESRKTWRVDVPFREL